MRRDGFTLIELLVVLSIIAILMAIGVPVLSRANDESYRSRCEARMQLIRLACQEHLQDYGDYPETLEQLVERGYVESETIRCSKTGRPFFYLPPGRAKARGLHYWLACVPPNTPPGRRPHGAGRSFEAMTLAGQMSIVGEEDAGGSR